MFIDQLKILFIENSKITDDMIEKIIKIKKHYWGYSEQEHKKWLQQNVNEDEYHFNYYWVK